MNKFLIIVVVLLSMFSCKQESKIDVDVSKIIVNVDIERFEQKFYDQTEKTLPKLKNEFPYLFPIHNSDSVWLHKIGDLQENELNDSAQIVFKTMEVFDSSKRGK